jgi:hypothetical protein
LKIICDKRNWPIVDGKGMPVARPTCVQLIQACFDNNLIPEYWKTHFGGLRSVLESGIPTPRNRDGAHGQGAVPTDVPEQLVAYVLHMTASTIVFLVESEKRLP